MPRSASRWSRASSRPARRPCAAGARLPPSSSQRNSMQLEWYGQSAFRLTDGQKTVFIDPFDDMSPIAGRGLQWDYPPIAGVSADLLLVTHEHLDHNGVGAIGGDPVV